MPAQALHHLADISDFLAALRVHGIPVGPAEIERLGRLFALEPVLHREALKTLLSTLFIKKNPRNNTGSLRDSLLTGVLTTRPSGQKKSLSRSTTSLLPRQCHRYCRTALTLPRHHHAVRGGSFV
jgi:hypothetical protein